MLIIAAVLLTALPAPQTPELCPPPKYVQWLGSQPVGRIAIVGGTSQQARFARGRFRRLTSGWRGSGPPVTVRLVEAASAADLASLARAEGLPAPPSAAFPQSYLLLAASPREIKIIGGPAGLIYGADTASQLFAAGRLRLAKISDWPTMLERGYTGCVRDTSPASMQRLAAFTDARLNAMYYEVYADRGQDSVPPEVSDVAAVCRPRAIFLYGLLSNWRTIRLVKRPLCPSRQEDPARVRRLSEELMDRGCQGLIFLFDDIPLSQVTHPQNCPKCRKRYGTLAAVQLALAGPLLEVGRARGAERFILCPTPYFRGWQNCYSGHLDGRKYFRQWAAAPQLRDVGIFHCVVRPERLRELFDAGLRNFVYWYNGGYKFFRWAPTGRAPEGVWDGLTDLAFGWYLCRWEPARGTVALPDAYRALRLLPRYTKRAWMCNGGAFRWLLWGTYTWAADKAVEPLLRRLAIHRFYGRDAGDAYLQWEGIVRPAWAKAMSNNFAEAMRQPAEAVAQLMRAAAAAQHAAERFEAAIARPAFPMPLAGPQRLERDAGLMAATAKALAAEAQRLAEGRVTIHIGPTRSSKAPDGATVNETPITLRRGPFAYALRYSQTIEPDGRKHRSKWHFGAGLGMKAPSLRNWYDAGFIDLVVNGRSLDAWTPRITAAGRGSDTRLVLRWATDYGQLTMEIRPRPDGGLQIDGALQPTAEINSAELRLWCIPGAGWGEWKDMDKAIVTASGTFPHGKPVTLKPGEQWIFYLDRTYDIPHPHAEGPCAAVFLDPQPAQITTDNGRYVVTTTATLAPARRRFRLVLYDFHGLKNDEALELFTAKLLPTLVMDRK